MLQLRNRKLLAVTVSLLLGAGLAHGAKKTKKEVVKQNPAELKNIQNTDHTENLNDKRIKKMKVGSSLKKQ